MSGPIVNSLKRWNRSWPLRLAIIGILLIPLIYGGLLVGAYWDPLGNLNQLPAALVNEDKPAKVDGQKIEGGKDLVEQALEGDELDWTVTNMTDAEDGLESGRYYLILHVPPDFSAKVASLESSKPQQAELEIITNDATNYLVGTFADNAVEAVEGVAIQNLQFEFLDVAYSAIGQLKEKGGEVVNGADRIAEGARTAADAAVQLAEGAKKVADGTSKVAEVGHEVAALARALPKVADTISDVSGEIAATTKEIEGDAAQVDDSLARLEQELKDANEPDLAKIAAAARSDFEDFVLKPTQDVAEVAAAAADESKVIAGDASQAVTAADDGAAKVQKLADGASQLSDGASEMADGLQNELAPGAEKLSAGLNKAAAKVPPVTDAEKTAFTQVLSEPIKVTDTRRNEVAVFGDGFAPYLMPLALYVGAMFLLLLIVPLNPRLAQLGSPVRAALKSYAPLVMFGVIGTIIMVTGLVTLIGLSAAALLPLFVVSLVSMACFIAMVQLLKSAFGVVGSYIAVVLLVLQVTSDAGAYPIETFGKFFNVIHPFLPMTYSVDGMRRTIAGGELLPYVGYDLLILTGVTLACLAGTAFVASRRKVLNAELLHPEVEIK